MISLQGPDSRIRGLWEYYGHPSGSCRTKYLPDIRATARGDLIESLVKELKFLADEMDHFLEISPNITSIRLLGGDDPLNCFAAILRMYYKDYRLAKLKWV